MLACPPSFKRMIRAAQKDDPVLAPTKRIGPQWSCHSRSSPPTLTGTPYGRGARVGGVLSSPPRSSIHQLPRRGLLGNSASGDRHSRNRRLNKALQMRVAPSGEFATSGRCFATDCYSRGIISMPSTSGALITEAPSDLPPPIRTAGDSSYFSSNRREGSTSDA